MFSAWSDPAHANGQQWHTIECAPAGATRSAYGNYRGDFTNKYGAQPANHKVDWRYTTKDGAAVMVKDTSNTAGAPPWLFMPRGCAAPGPPVPASGPPPATPPPATPRRRRRPGAPRRSERSAGRRASRATARSCAAPAAGTSTTACAAWPGLRGTQAQEAPG